MSCGPHLKNIYVLTSVSTTDLIVEFFLEGWGKIRGHLSNSVAGSITDPWVLNRTNIFHKMYFFFY